MSRCFPYPPRGYLHKGSLIESIKLQKDKEKAKEERRKERKRVKKDKRRKREPIIEKFHKLEKQTSSLEDMYALSHGDDISSDVTEEHEQPVCGLKLCYPLENRQNSDKRCLHESPANNFHGIGPSNSGKTSPIGQHDFGFGQMLVEGQPCGTSTTAEFCVPGISPFEKQSTFLETQVMNEDMAVFKSLTSKPSKAELLYKSMLESWVSPILGSEQWFNDDEQGWLFQRKFQNTERSEIHNNLPCSLDLNLCPRAQLLPSLDVYALPYRIPF